MELSSVAGGRLTMLASGVGEGGGGVGAQPECSGELSSREKGGSGSARSIPFLLLPFISPPLKLPLPGLELIRSAPVGAVRGRGLLT